MCVLIIEHDVDIVVIYAPVTKFNTLIGFVTIQIPLPFNLNKKQAGILSY